MKTIKNIALILSLLFVVTGCEAQIKNAKKETVKVYGNCGMCKKTIEKAANEKGIVKADWDIDSNMLTMTYDSAKTNPDAVLKKVAYAGYDSDKFRAPDEAYDALHGCCQYDRPVKNTAKAESHDAHKGHDMAEMTKEAQGGLMDKVTTAYFAVKDGLVKSNGAAVATAAGELTKAIAAVPMDKMSPEQHTIWMKVLPAVKEDAEHISDTKDVKHQRDHFTTLSANMYQVLKTFKTNEAVYYQKCPMFNDGKGANWLSKDKDIKNPYYGSAMLTCGSTVETLK
jgi:copper chaperone CopZ